MRIENPYSAPGDPRDEDEEGDLPDDLPEDREPPKVVRAFKVYAVAMAVAFGLFSILGVAAAIGSQFMPQNGKGDEDPTVLLIVGICYAAMGLAFAIPFTMAPFLPRKPWVWVFDLVIICLGLTSPCCMPASIPLLIYWLKPESKAYFGRE